MKILLIATNPEMIEIYQQSSDTFVENNQEDEYFQKHELNIRVEDPLNGLRLLRTSLEVDKIIVQETFKDSFSGIEFIKLFNRLKLKFYLDNDIQIFFISDQKKVDKDFFINLNISGLLFKPLTFLSFYKLNSYFLRKIHNKKEPEKLIRDIRSDFYDSRIDSDINVNIGDFINKSYTAMSYKQLKFKYQHKNKDIDNGVMTLLLDTNNVVLNDSVALKKVIDLSERLIKTIIDFLSIFLEFADLSLVLTYLNNELQQIKLRKQLSSNEQERIVRYIVFLFNDIKGLIKRLKDEDLENIHYLTASLAVVAKDISSYIIKINKKKENK